MDLAPHRPLYLVVATPSAADVAVKNLSSVDGDSLWP